MSGCTACDNDCSATFTCWVCLESKSVCVSKPGGFKSDELICDVCHFNREMGVDTVEDRERKDADRRARETQTKKIARARRKAALTA